MKYILLIFCLNFQMAVIAIEEEKMDSIYNDNNSLDSNYDSINDVFYEDSDNEHYELIDRNAVTAMEGYKIGSAYNDNNSLDLNHDSIKDVLYEYVDNGHYELVDRNFDGKIDASYFFDTDYLIVKSKEDDDFDNFLESVTFYKYSLGVVTTVDSDLDNFTDIIFCYLDGVIDYAEKYESYNNNNYITRYSFKFSFPKIKTHKLTKMTKKEFHDKAISFSKLLKCER